jgi:hypothetical protein
VVRAQADVAFNFVGLDGLVALFAWCCPIPSPTSAEERVKHQHVKKAAISTKLNSSFFI